MGLVCAWQVSNPTAEEVTFDVVLAGPGLLGEPAVTLGAGESCSYEAVFSPLVPGAAQGCVCRDTPPSENSCRTALTASRLKRRSVVMLDLLVLAQVGLVPTPGDGRVLVRDPAHRRPRAAHTGLR